MYLGPGGSLFEVDFDIKSEPHIRALYGAAYREGIPEDDKRKLLKEIRNKYPHGFHFRSDMGIEWLKARLQKLVADNPVNIKAVEPYGCLMVDGHNHDTYKVEIEHKMKNTVYVVMTALCKEFVVFRPYIQYAEFGNPQNISDFQYEEIPIDSKIYETMFFEEEIVSFRKYSYEGDKLKAESFGFKNQELGVIYESKFGKFIRTGEVSYVI